MALPVVWIMELRGPTCSLDLFHSDLIRCRCWESKFVGVHPAYVL